MIILFCRINYRISRQSRKNCDVPEELWVLVLIMKAVLTLMRINAAIHYDFFVYFIFCDEEDVGDGEEVF